MKIDQILPACLLLVVSSLTAVHAENSQTAPEPSTDETASMDRNAYTESLFKGRCQMCHQLPEPSMLKAKQWKLILVVMQQRMQQAGVPPLTEEETEMLMEYLSARAR